MINDGTAPGRGRKRTGAAWRWIGLRAVGYVVRRIATLTVAMSLAAFGVAACGSSTRPGTTTAVASNTGLTFARCMRATGVPNFPDPSGSSGEITVRSSGPSNTLTVNGVSVNAPAFRSATAKCQRDLPAGHVSAARFAEISKGALAMARCMRSRGISNFPDPTVSDGPQGLIVTGNLKAARIDITAPAFQHAMKICQPLEGLPSPRRG